MKSNDYGLKKKKKKSLFNHSADIPLKLLLIGLQPPLASLSPGDIGAGSRVICMEMGVL